VGEAADERLVDLAEVIGSKFIFDDSPKVLDELGFTPDFAVVSPGFAPSHPLVQELENRKVQLITDIDLAYRLRDKTPRDRKVDRGDRDQRQDHDVRAHSSDVGSRWAQSRRLRQHWKPNFGCD
jgi:hypothetical protein